MNEAYCCLHEVHKLVEKERERESYKETGRVAGGKLTACKLSDVITKNCRGTKERVTHLF